MSVPPEHGICARCMEFGMRVGFAALAATLAVYLGGFLDPLVPAERLVQLWGLSAERYVAETGAPVGAQWWRGLGRGDYENLLPVALLLVATMACYARLATAFMRQKRHIQALLALAQVLVLLAAASGALS